MYAPNIANLTTIIGVTTSKQLTTTPVTVLSNPSGSNKVYRINTILAANETGATSTVTIRYNDSAAGAGTTLVIANGIDVGTKTTLIVLDKASSLYLEENRSITALCGTSNAIDLHISYEDIS